MEEYIALAVFALVYFLIIGRRQLHVPIWVAMLIGAALMIGLQVISIESAFESINLDVIAFLFGMFSIVTALDRSGVLRLAAIKMLSKARSPASLLMVLVIGMGLLAAFLVNDTIALLGVPLVIYIARYLAIRPAVLLMALAFGVTVGSTMTPIGNPQNLLIAIESGISLPFTTFIIYLAVPTLVNLFITWYILKIYFQKELLQIGNKPHVIVQENTIADPRYAKLSVSILLITIVGFVISEILHFIHITMFSLSIITMLGAAALYALSSDRREIIKNVDYSVLVFFAAMFVFTSALWSSGAVPMIMEYMPNPDPNDIFQSNAIISAVSILLSQVLSNVPFVALYNFVMFENGFTNADVDQWMMLAAASTIAGNLTILGAASNIIIIEAAESRNVKAFTFLEFFKIGSLITLVNVAVYYLFIVFI